MELITVRELFKNTEAYAGQTVTIGGWVRNKRPSKQFGFIVLNDGTYFTPVQVVYDTSIENFQEISKINVGAALIVEGKVVLTPGAKQPFEIQAASVTVEGPSTGDYPLQPKKHSMEFLRSITHLRPRANTFQAVFRVRSLAAMAIHQFFQERDFVYVHTPLITGSDCEGAGEMFQVTTLDLNNVPKTEDGKVDFSQDFYGKPTNLTVSGQLNGETFAMAFRNIYTFGPTFRAENSNTNRHAAEFWMIEPEMAFADLQDLMRVEEDMLKYIISYVLEHAPEEMAFFNQFVDKGLLDRLNNIPKTEDGKVDFSQDFYGKPTNLTVSGQLNGETFAMAFRNIYTFGPTFRAENSNTTRHAAEFWMIEPEMAFADLQDLMRVEEDMLKYIISYVLEHAPEEMNFFNQFIDKGLLDRLNNVLNNDFGHITYTDAVALLEKHNDKFEYPVSWGCDLQTEHERYLTEEVFKKPVFVTDYPKDIKAFYMKLNPDGKTVAAVDCLVPGVGEITGGSQREDNYDILKNRIEELGMNPEDYSFYMDLRKYGSARHAGFGLGFERCVMYLTGMGNIRDVLPFPRTVGNCEL